jgi:hypothetical protein
MYPPIESDASDADRARTIKSRKREIRRAAELCRAAKLLDHRYNLDDDPKRYRWPVVTMPRGEDSIYTDWIPIAVAAPFCKGLRHWDIFTLGGFCFIGGLILGDRETRRSILPPAVTLGPTEVRRVRDFTEWAEDAWLSSVARLVAEGFLERRPGNAICIARSRKTLRQCT